MNIAHPITLSFAALIFVSLPLTACGNEARPATTPVGVSVALTSHPEREPPPPSMSGSDGTIVVSKDIAKRCGITESGPSPRFDFDSAALRPRGRDILDTLARCMLDGSLKGESVALVGHTDPRGEDEYNIALGSYRAQSVSSYLEKAGVPSQRLRPSSRGELDARGNDVQSWALDRRVDIATTSGS